MRFIISSLAAVAVVFSFPVMAQGPSLDDETRQDYECLALNIYYESRGSNLADMAAVSDVVLNRVQDMRYPGTICGVVKQGPLDSKGNPIRHKCQFSWYCDGRSDRPTDEDSYKKALLIAGQMLFQGRYRGISEGATHYHANYVNPGWAKKITQIGRIGDHIFYRWD